MKKPSPTVDRRCIECGVVIPQERLAAIPDTETCVVHSRVMPRTIYNVEIDRASETNAANLGDGQ